MSFQQRIQNQLFKKKKDPFELLDEVLFVFAKEFHWTYEDFMVTPLPVIMSLTEKLNGFNKSRAKALKKKR